MRRSLRSLIVGLASLLVGPALGAQAQGPAAGPDDAPARQIAALRADSSALRLPADRDIVRGARTIAAGETVAGPIATVGGRLDIFGTVNGDATAIDGDVVVHSGGHVTGSVLSAFGRAVADSGVVDGELRELGGAVGAPPAPAVARAASATTFGSLKLAMGWLAFLLLTGIGTLVFAHDYLDGVVDTLEHHFARSFWAGVAGQLALLPALLALVVVLAITIVGILLIPFGVVAFGISAAGILTLGFLAAAQVTGRSLLRPSAHAALSPRGASLRSIVVGVFAYFVLWILAAALTRFPAASAAVAALAFVVTWVGTTAGFGAALLSRAGTRSRLPVVTEAAPAPAVAAASWQTPTPLTGVAAARRPTATVGGRAE